MKRFYKNGLKASLVAIVAMFGFSMSQADSPRFVVMEQFTNTSCGPCAAINPQFHAGLEQRDAFVIPLVYHWYYPSKQDPMYTIDITMNEERAKVYGVTGVPSASINGAAKTHPANFVNAGFSGFDNVKGQTSPIDISVSKTNSSTTVEVTSSVELKNHTLQVVVVEDPVDYGMTFPNGEDVFPWVPRQMLPSYSGTQLNLNAGQSMEFNFNYDISRALVTDNVHIVAFVQDNSTNEILQGRADNSEEPLFVAASVDNRYLKTQDGGSSPFTVTLSNSNDFEVTGNLSINSTNIPAGWTASLDNTSYTIAANSSITVTGTVEANAGTAGFIPVEIAVDVDDTQGMTGIESTTTLYSLSTATKSVYYFNTNSATQLMVSTIANSELGSDIAYMAASDELFSAYGPENFDFAIFATDYPNRGQIGVNLADEVSAHIADGNDVLIMSNLDLYNGLINNGGVAAAHKLFGDLGIGAGTYVQTSQTNGNQISLSPITVTGAAGTEFEGMTFNLNAYNSQSHPYYTQFVDEVVIKDAQKAEKLLDLSVAVPTQRNVMAGTGSQVGNSKVMFLTFGFELIAQPGQRTMLASAISEWFAGDGVVIEGPAISASTEELDFGTVVIGESKEMTVTISNTGTEALTIEDPYFFLTEGTNVFTVKDESIFPATVAVDGSMDVTVVFTPAEEGTVSDDLEITTNAEGDETFYITVTGMGQESNAAGAISLSSETVEFGEVVVGEDKTMNFIISNSGNANLVVSAINLMSTTSPFTITNMPSGALTLEPSKTFEVEVMVDASAEGSFSNSIEILSNDPNNATSTVTLSAQVVASVDYIDENEFALSAAPNVFSGSTTLMLEARTKVSNSIELYLVDISGNKVQDIYSGVISNREITLDGSTLAAGKYFVIAKRGNSQTAMHVIVK